MGLGVRLLSGLGFGGSGSLSMLLAPLVHSYARSRRQFAQRSRLHAPLAKAYVGAIFYVVGSTCGTGAVRGHRSASSAPALPACTTPPFIPRIQQVLHPCTEPQETPRAVGVGAALLKSCASSAAAIGFLSVHALVQITVLPAFGPVQAVSCGAGAWLRLRQHQAALQGAAVVPSWRRSCGLRVGSVCLSQAVFLHAACQLSARRRVCVRPKGCRA